MEENLLAHLQRPEFAELYAVLKKRSYPKGAFICQPDGGENQIFIVAGGRARVYLGYEDKEFNIGILSQGDIYSSHTRAFVQALDDIDVLAADTQTFGQKMLDDPEVAKAMVGILGSMLKNSFTIIENLIFKDVNSRLVGLLVNEAKKHGTPGADGGIIIKIDLSVEQIAFLVGSTRQTVSTFLNQLSRQGVIKKMGRGKFFISDLAGLETLQNSGSV
ncbi:Crp/Fnr family transcriptional regulator [uncultured Desulfobacter sp.]|uniref:Crp/Fnr family transcriptional regulator n=1 Tax=uncultured Desulfobacter sp. TaxID=240139 RepID=UPI002AAC44DA|nr:Crp/Fnr family transcriptional regulator [uncultured Desulfobacter sp.]